MKPFLQGPCVASHAILKLTSTYGQGIMGAWAWLQYHVILASLAADGLHVTLRCRQGLWWLLMVGILGKGAVRHTLLALQLIAAISVMSPALVKELVRGIPGQRQVPSHCHNVLLPTGSPMSHRQQSLKLMPAFCSGVMRRIPSPEAGGNMPPCTVPAH